MAIDEIIEEMRRNDRLLKESVVVLAVQKELIKMGYEPFEERVMGIYDAIDNVPKVCIMEQYDALYEKANKGGWIPCSEKLPPYDGNYICTAKDIPESLELIYASWDKSWMDEFDSIYEVVAWQYKPEPYKGV